MLHKAKKAAAIMSCQQEEGFWTRSMLDPEHAPGRETGGTAFFTYVLLWGINNGLLSDFKFKNAAVKGWKYLSEIALQPDGRIGYVQPIGEKAIPGQVVDTNSTAPNCGHRRRFGFRRRLDAMDTVRSGAVRYHPYFR
nr:glycoside hydrolase family 88 protein [Sphingobacterium sp. GVS05A]